MKQDQKSSRYAYCALIGGVLVTTLATAATNYAPIIYGRPSTSVTAGNSYAFQPSAFDFNRDPLSFSISSKPSWATFDARTGRLSGKPTTSQAGSYEQILISVSD